MTTRKAYEMAIRILGLATLLGAATYAMYGLAVFSGSFAPGMMGFSSLGGISSLAGALIMAGMGLAMILVAPGLARRLEPREVRIGLPANLDERAILRLAIRIIGVSMAAYGLASLIRPVIEVLARPETVTIPGRTTDLVYPLARFAVGLILVFHQRLLGSVKTTGERIRRSEEGDVDGRW